MPQVFDPQAMDNAATQAALELEKLPVDAVHAVAMWWLKFYLQAGHKRLGRVLLVKLSQKEKKV